MEITERRQFFTKVFRGSDCYPCSTPSYATETVMTGNRYNIPAAYPANSGERNHCIWFVFCFRFPVIGYTQWLRNKHGGK